MFIFEICQNIHLRKHIKDKKQYLMVFQHCYTKNLNALKVYNTGSLPTPIRHRMYTTETTDCTQLFPDTHNL